MVGAGSSELFGLQADDSPEISAAEVGVVEYRPGQVGLSEIGVDQYGADQPGIGKSSAAEFGPGQICPYQIDTG